jgi:hypothetical protein
MQERTPILALANLYMIPNLYVRGTLECPYASGRSAKKIL